MAGKTCTCDNAGRSVIKNDIFNTVFIPHRFSRSRTFRTVQHRKSSQFVVGHLINELLHRNHAVINIFQQIFCNTRTIFYYNIILYFSAIGKQKGFYIRSFCLRHNQTQIIGARLQWNQPNIGVHCRSILIQVRCIAGCLLIAAESVSKQNVLSYGSILYIIRGYFCANIGVIIGRTISKSKLIHSRFGSRYLIGYVSPCSKVLVCNILNITGICIPLILNTKLYCSFFKIFQRGVPIKIFASHVSYIFRGSLY